MTYVIIFLFLLSISNWFYTVYLIDSQKKIRKELEAQKEININNTNRHKLQDAVMDKIVRGQNGLRDMINKK
jgi:hypothetical protein